MILPLPRDSSALRTYHLFNGGPNVRWDESGLIHTRLDPDPQAQTIDTLARSDSEAQRPCPDEHSPAVSASVWSPVGLPLTGNDLIVPVTRAASTIKITPDLISNRSVVIVVAFQRCLPGYQLIGTLADLQTSGVRRQHELCRLGCTGSVREIVSH